MLNKFSPDQFVPLERLRPREKIKNWEAYAGKMFGMMREISERVNQEASEQYGLDNFLDSDGSLNMDGYAEGPHNAGQVQKDKRKVLEEEIKFSGARSRDTQEKYKVNSPEEVVPLWRENKKKDKSFLMEAAATALLHRILGQDYLVVRASSYDDIFGHVDNVIINKETGEAICAFDEVHVNDKSDRVEGKQKKVKEFAVGGGAEVSYGIKMEAGKLKRAQMFNVPVFYLGLNEVELENLLKGLNSDLDGEIQPAERETFAKLTVSLQEQKQMLDKIPNVHFAVKKKLQTFGRLLADFEERG